MKVLAIDPGYGRCGVAVVEKTPRGEALIYSDCIETDAASDFPARLAEIISECGRLIAEHKPDAVALEKLFFTSNQKTAMRVAEVRGALIEMASEHGLSVFEYGPGQVKGATTGSGRADKQQVVKMLNALLNITKKIRHDDEYDAIAIGITHLAHMRPPFAQHS